MADVRNIELEHSAFKSVTDNLPTRTIAKLGDLFSQSSLQAHAEPSPGVFDDKEARAEFKQRWMRGLFCPALFTPGQPASKATVQKVTALVYDFDDVAFADVADIRDEAEKYAHVYHTSFSHSADPACWKFRIVLPIDRPMSADEHAHAWEAVGLKLFGGRQDPQCRNANRMYFALHCQARFKAAFSLAFHDGPVLRVQDALQWPAPQASLPVARHATGEVYRPNRVEFGKWLREEAPECVSGRGGSVNFMRVMAQAIRRGAFFDPGELLVFPPFETWNRERCRPPWSAGEIMHGHKNALVRWQDEGLAVLPRLMKTLKGGLKFYPRVDSETLRVIMEQDAELVDEFWFDELTCDIRRQDGRPIKDAEISAVRTKICERYPLSNLSTKEVFDAVVSHAQQNSRNPVTEYLRGLVWDGQSRLDDVARDVLHADMNKNPLAGECVKNWFLGAAARGLEPGCQMDNALILKGKQGIRKTSFFRTIAINPEWFMSTDIDLTSKDALQALCTTWIYEWGELSSMRSAKDVQAVKGIVTRTTEKFRPAYGRLMEYYKRPGVIAGSTNDTDILRDRTGGRRFWVVECVGEIDLAKAQEWAPQLWAESVARLAAGEQYWLRQSDEDTLEQVNLRYSPERPLYTLVCDEIEKGALLNATDCGTFFLMFNDLCEAIEMNPRRLGSFDRNEIESALIDCGWEKQARRSVARGGVQLRVRAWWPVSSDASGVQAASTSTAKVVHIRP